MAANLLDRMDARCHSLITVVSIGIHRSRGCYLLILHTKGTVQPHWLQSLHVELTHDDRPETYLARATWRLITPERLEADLDPVDADHPFPPFPGGVEETFTPFRAVRLARPPNRSREYRNDTSLRSFLEKYAR